MHLKKFKVFSSLRRPEVHFRRAQGHQRAGALTSSINIFQSTISTVYEIEHQKTLTQNLENRLFGFQKLIKDFYHFFQEK